MMRLLVRQFGRWVLAVALQLLVVSGSAAAQDSWQDVADERDADQAEADQAVADNPAWDQYAFTLESLSGSDETSFVDLARSGHPFILVYWLMDCPLCHLQLPQVQQLQETIERNELDVRVVAVNLDHSATEASEFFEEQDMSFELLHDSRARHTDEAFHISELGCPLTYVFDSEGELVDYLTGYRAQLEKNVFTLLDIALSDEAQVK
jgi:peroxiredoxin